jgi:hypothetical protein
VHGVGRRGIKLINFYVEEFGLKYNNKQMKNTSMLLKRYL